MTLDASLRERARRQLARIARKRRDPRYQAVVGRLVAEGLLQVNHPVSANHEPIEVKDALWVGQVELRVLELLPALLVKCPNMFVDGSELPSDLEACVKELRRSRTPPSFRDIPGTKLLYWLPRVGRKNKLPSRLKSFRLQAHEQRALEQLSEALSLSETDVVRQALSDLAARVLPGR